MKEILAVGAFRLFGSASMFISKDWDCTVQFITRYWLVVLLSECCGVWRRVYGCLPFILLMWTFGRAADNANKWQMGFNSLA